MLAHPSILILHFHSSPCTTRPQTWIQSGALDSRLYSTLFISNVLAARSLFSLFICYKCNFLLFFLFYFFLSLFTNRRWHEVTQRHRVSKDYHIAATCSFVARFVAFISILWSEAYLFLFPLCFCTLYQCINRFTMFSHNFWFIWKLKTKTVNPARGPEHTAHLHASENIHRAFDVKAILIRAIFCWNKVEYFVSSTQSTAIVVHWRCNQRSHFETQFEL